MHQPCERALCHPAPGEHHEPCHVVGALDDLQGQGEFLTAPVDEGSGVAAVSPDAGDVAVQTVQPRKQAHGGVAVADVRGGDRDDQEQTERVGHDVPFTARHFLPAVVAA